MIIDTNIIIKRYKENREITENITIISAMEFPPILKYDKFMGNVYTITSEDQVLAIKLQRRLRKAGLPKSVPDLLIGAICINQNEELISRDREEVG